MESLHRRGRTRYYFLAAAYRTRSRREKSGRVIRRPSTLLSRSNRSPNHFSFFSDFFARRRFGGFFSASFHCSILIFHSSTSSLSPAASKNLSSSTAFSISFVSRSIGHILSSSSLSSAASANLSSLTAKSSCIFTFATLINSGLILASAATLDADFCPSLYSYLTASPATTSAATASLATPHFPSNAAFTHTGAPALNPIAIPSLGRQSNSTTSPPAPLTHSLA
mmetsp:Transcript_16965/g.45489  ORF Transcript_16965/g.45489 Transcript_16965/m.45489 type:complete len:225 (-) Transcript_16965:9-683(-)